MHKGSVWVMADKMTDELGFQRKSEGSSSEGEASGYNECYAQRHKDRWQSHELEIHFNNIRLYGYIHRLIA